MKQHFEQCRCQHMSVSTDITDLEGCDCALIDEVLTNREQQIAAALWPLVHPIVDWIASVNMVKFAHDASDNETTQA